MLLNLPIDLRIIIYTAVIASCPCRKSLESPTCKHQTAVNMLLEKRQIYNEAREIIFEFHDFEFRGWSGTSVHIANGLFKCLKSWQRRAAWSLSLWTVESCFINFSTANFPSNGPWMNICSTLGDETLHASRLRELRLIIGGELMLEPELISPNADWIVRGLGRLSALRQLVIILINCIFERHYSACFKDTLTYILPNTTIIMRRGGVLGPS